MGRACRQDRVGKELKVYEELDGGSVHSKTNWTEGIKGEIKKSTEAA